MSWNWNLFAAIMNTSACGFMLLLGIPNQPMAVPISITLFILNAFFAVGNCIGYYHTWKKRK